MATAAAPSLLGALIEAPSKLNKFIDACTCGRSDKAAVQAIKMELEAKDSAIERLEEEIRRKDTEKDNLIEMQRDLQSQIEEIRLMLEAHATEAAASPPAMSQAQAAGLMQRRARGISGRRRVQQLKAKRQGNEQAIVKMQSVHRGNAGRQRVAKKETETRSAVMLQARVRGKSSRRLVNDKRMARQKTHAPPANGGPLHPALGGGGGGVPSSAAYDGLDALSGGTSSMFDDNESVDSDYDYDEEDFSSLGLELLAGKLKLAKVYGQEEPPAAEDDLEWEIRYFVLYDSGRVCHFDDIVNGLPVGDRGLIELEQIKSVEKVLNANTFVMKAANKVYLLKLQPHDEVMMRTWIAAISQELAPR